MITIVSLDVDELAYRHRDCFGRDEQSFCAWNLNPCCKRLTILAHPIGNIALCSVQPSIRLGRSARAHRQSICRILAHSYFAEACYRGSVDVILSLVTDYSDVSFLLILWNLASSVVRSAFKTSLGALQAVTDQAPWQLVGRFPGAKKQYAAWPVTCGHAYSHALKTRTSASDIKTWSSMIRTKLSLKLSFSFALFAKLSTRFLQTTTLA